MVEDAPAKPPARRNFTHLAICLALVAVTVALYAQTGGFDFVDYDDNVYLYENPHVRAGLTPESVKWALSASVDGNWAPVTMLSHLAAVQVFEMQAGMHHLVNLLFHAGAVVLLFLALRRATGAAGPSAFVAFVFALHPLHVESVAWVSERKDVLSAFFWFLALYAYIRYCERPGERRYVLMAGALCLGLMSKAMLVTFPFTLLLFDVWPLRRFRWPASVLEKIPLLAICAGASVVTYVVQKAAGAVEPIPLAVRIGNAFLSYTGYIGQTFWPQGLACLYPYQPYIGFGSVAAALAILVAISVAIACLWRARPYLAVGWLWYLGTLVPVIGLVQVGIQAHADRYMYVPMAGLLMMVAWGAADLVKTWPRLKPAVAVMAVACCAAAMAAASKQIGYWENGGTLFERALALTENNWVAEFGLGVYLNSIERPADAIPHFENALRIKPDEARAEDGWGASLIRLGECPEAIRHFEAALRAKPRMAKASYNIGYCLATNGDDAGAIPYFEAAARDQPDYADARTRLGMSLSKIPGRTDEAIRAYEDALRLTPDDGRLHARLGQLLAQAGRREEAIAELETAERLQPDPAISAMLASVRASQKH